MCVGLAPAPGEVVLNVRAELLPAEPEGLERFELLIYASR